MAHLRIGLSHGDDDDYGNYPRALKRIGAALGHDVETVWLNGPHDDAPLDGIVFTGGPDVDPARYGRAEARPLCEIDAPRDAAEYGLAGDSAIADLPTLAICRGMQLQNVVAGGTLIPHLDIADAHVRKAGVDAQHGVAVADDSMLAPFAREESATNSAHHQAVDTLADGFRAIAHAADGTIEAYARTRDDGPFFLALQWHPERMEGRPLGDGPIRAFIEACAARR